MRAEIRSYINQSNKRQRAREEQHHMTQLVEERQRRKQAFLDEFTNPMLEKSLQRRIRDPEEFKILWKRVEHAKRSHQYLHFKNTYMYQDDWEKVGKKSFYNGSPNVLELIMHTFGFVTLAQAKKEFEDYLRF